MEYTKVYAVLYNSYELDDIEHGELTPLFLSLSKDKCIKQFNKWKEEEIESFNKLYKIKEEWLNEHPEFKENYEISINNEKELLIYKDNWCYNYELIEYDLDKKINIIYY